MPEQQPKPELAPHLAASATEALSAITAAYEAVDRADSAIRAFDRQTMLPVGQMFWYELDGLDPLCIPNEMPENDLTRNFAGRIVLSRSIVLPLPDTTNRRHRHAHLYPYNVCQDRLAQPRAKRTAMLALDRAALQSDRLTIVGVHKARQLIGSALLLTAKDLLSAWTERHPGLA